MRELIERVAKYLEKENEDIVNARSLRKAETEFLNAKEAFELGIVLQRMHEMQTEISHVGINEVIKFVRNNVSQAKY